MRRRGSSNGGIILLAFLIGIPAFLLMTHPITFWLIFVPLVALGIIKFIMWLKK